MFEADFARASIVGCAAVGASVMPQGTVSGAARVYELLGTALGWRFSKFAVVGGLGTVVNMLCLWLVVRWVFSGHASGFNLSVAQLAAIAVATVHNFAWNRLWTWKDRQTGDRNWRADFGRYASVAGLSISLQLLCVALLRDYVHYLLAAGFGIALASVAAFLLNDRWSFKTNQNVTHSAPMSTDDVLRSIAAGLVAVCAYLYAIDSSLIPKNGDENVYLHITRVTGTSAKIPGVLTASGWLPLKSELNNMRNTKPPLLFFQARAAAELRGKWDIAVLRLPSLIYTFATAGLVVAVGLTLRLGLLPALGAALLWLAFFSTFRFGRPFLTTAPEVFWLFASLLAVLRWPVANASTRAQLPWIVGVGGLVGLGLLHKSFALALPTGLGLGLVLLLRHAFEGQQALKKAVLKSAMQTTLVCCVALALFAMWFVFDPDPASVWQEFVVGENMGKLGEEKRSWVAGFFMGGDSVWAYSGSVLLNPGLLFLVCAAGLVICVKTFLPKRGADSLEALRNNLPVLLLLLWCLAWVLVFALPSQRSARYVLPAMPAVALLVAWAWGRIPAWLLRVNFVFVAAFAVAAVLFGGLVRSAVDPLRELAWLNLAVAAAAVAICSWGLLRPKAWAMALPTASLLVYLAFAAAFRPLDADSFSPVANKHLSNVTVAVPCNFRAKFEEHRFLLPNANIVGVHERINAKAAALATVYPAFVVRTSIFGMRPLCLDCEVMGSRAVFKSRHSGDEIKAMFAGQWAENLLGREWLVRVKRDAASPQPVPDAKLLKALELPEARCL